MNKTLVYWVRASVTTVENVVNTTPGKYLTDNGFNAKNYFKQPCHCMKTYGRFVEQKFRLSSSFITTTLSITTFNIMGLFVTQSINEIQHSTLNYAECRDYLIVMLNVVMLSVVEPSKQRHDI